jgi:hypothetical protein
MTDYIQCRLILSFKKNDFYFRKKKRFFNGGACAKSVLSVTSKIRPKMMNIECLAGAETGAAGGFIGVRTLERLQAQFTARRFHASKGGFFDGTEASRFDIVHAFLDTVHAFGLDFDGGIGGFVVFAIPFVLERFLTFDPIAAQITFDGGAVGVVLEATGGSNADFGVVDVAFHNDVFLEKSIAFVQSFTLTDASGGFGSLTCAIVPSVAVFESFAVIQRFAVLHASGNDETSAGFFAGVHEFIFRYFIVEIDSFATVHATADNQNQIIALFLTGDCVLISRELFTDGVFGASADASFLADGRFAVAAQGAGISDVFVVAGLANFETFLVWGEATFGEQFTVLAQIVGGGAVDQIAVFAQTLTIARSSFGGTENGGCRESDQYAND